ncbi:3-deoxy-manno-octulosonate cytidylyltransferase [Gammaproteobacteria bacterium]|nr:3-deoxy-manno-octulosonate cytidylyltransferase [Gammaproteobacteria bacterium]
MSFTVIIPARYSAQRLPGKPLLDINGKPMLQHTYERACSSEAKNVYIATDDDRIRRTAENFGAKVFMTLHTHRSGTDRIQEVSQRLRLEDDEIVVNVQADEPLIPSVAINQVAKNLLNSEDVGIATLCEIISSQEEIEDCNAVKVVMDERGHALYFSRATIPYQASASAKNSFRHIGIYAYRVKVLNKYVRWPPSELEISEKLEQLRALYNGVKMHVDLASVQIPAGVDTEKDLNAVRALLSCE